MMASVARRDSGRQEGKHFIAWSSANLANNNTTFGITTFNISPCTLVAVKEWSNIVLEREKEEPESYPFPYGVNNVITSQLHHILHDFFFSLPLFLINPHILTIQQAWPMMSLVSTLHLSYHPWRDTFLFVCTVHHKVHAFWYCRCEVRSVFSPPKRHNWLVRETRKNREKNMIASGKLHKRKKRNWMIVWHTE